MCAMKLEMVPDSGHHYFFIPLCFASDNESVRHNALTRMSDSDERKMWLTAGWLDKGFYKLISPLAKGDKYPWHNYDWEEGLSWVRYRLGFKAAKNPGSPKMLGLWLVMESNVGNIGRGTLAANRLPSTEDIERFDRGELHNSPNPYVFTDRQPSDDKVTAVDFRPHFMSIMEHIIAEATGDKPKETVDWGKLPELKIVWNKQAGEDIDVDLIIDFGNTRTAAVSLITNADMRNVMGISGSAFRPLTFVDETDECWDSDCESDGLVDSYFALREPMFHVLKEEVATVYETEEEHEEQGLFDKMLGKQPVTHKKLKTIKEMHPQKFVQVAHAVIGPALNDVLNDPKNQDSIQKGGSYVQSSPKRYYWDNDAYGRGGNAWWNMFNRPWDEKDATLRGLSGEVTKYLPSDGSYWSLDNPPDKWPKEQSPVIDVTHASYPRSDTLTWMALSILETAYRQLNSPHFNENNMPYIPRQFNGIYLTYPSGWTKDEITTFRQKWEKARNIFALLHLPDATEENCPKVVMEVDEAVASQLPFVYSEIESLKRLKPNTMLDKKPSVLWLEQIGRTAADGKPRARIMTLDIGGGTADTSIIEYSELNTEDSNGLIRLKAELLFKDSESTAGDMLVKRIIEKVLLPAIVNNDIALLNDSWNGRMADGERNKKQLMLRQVLVPIVRFWMGRLGSGMDDALVSSENRCFSPREMGVESSNWNELVKMFKLEMEDDTPILVSEAQIVQCVNDVFCDGFVQNMAKIAVAFGVDAVVVCGKVSELPQLKDVLKTHLPLSGNRIVFLKDYYAGDWYPTVFAHAGHIKDPKTATVSGAALYHAFNKSMIAGWELIYDNQKFTSRNNWRLKSAKKNFLNRDDASEEATISNVPLDANALICRSQFNAGFSSEPVYKVRLKQWSSKNGRGMLDELVLRRYVEDNVERLELVSASGTFRSDSGDEEVIGTNDVEMILHPMTDEVNWQESTKLDF